MKDASITRGGGPTFRTPVLLLTIANLALLGTRLWPWPNIMNLPGSGSTGLDPVISLFGYVALIFWIGNTDEADDRKALFSAGLLGLFAGLFMVAQIHLASLSPTGESFHPNREQIALLGAAALLWGIAGLRTARSGNTLGFSAVCAAWAAMVSCLMGCTALLAQAYLGGGVATAPDPWKDFQGIAIGSPATQALVQALNLVTGLLLLGPIAGCVAGSVFAALGKPGKA
jgi:hypothetical protein